MIKNTTEKMTEKSTTEMSESISKTTMTSRVRGRGRGRTLGAVFVTEKMKNLVIDTAEGFGSDEDTLKGDYERSSLTIRGRPIGSRPKGVLSAGRSFGRGRGGRIFKEETNIDP